MPIKWVTEDKSAKSRPFPDWFPELETLSDTMVDLIKRIEFKRMLLLNEDNSLKITQLEFEISVLENKITLHYGQE